jgi:hypothetical protein
MDIIGLEQQQQLPEAERLSFAVAYGTEAKNPATAFWLSLFLGFFGIDRMYLGQYGLGVLKLATLGGCWIWSLVDVFIISEAARTHNRQVAIKVRTTLDMARSARRLRGPAMVETDAKGLHTTPNGKYASFDHPDVSEAMQANRKALEETLSGVAAAKEAVAEGLAALSQCAAEFEAARWKLGKACVDFARLVDSHIGTLTSGACRLDDHIALLTMKRLGYLTGLAYWDGCPPDVSVEYGGVTPEGEEITMDTELDALAAMNEAGAEGDERYLRDRKAWLWGLENFSDRCLPDEKGEGAPWNPYKKDTPSLAQRNRAIMENWKARAHAQVDEQAKALLRNLNGKSSGCANGHVWVRTDTHLYCGECGEEQR